MPRNTSVYAVSCNKMLFLLINPTKLNKITTNHKKNSI